MNKKIRVEIGLEEDFSQNREIYICDSMLLITGNKDKDNRFSGKIDRQIADNVFVAIFIKNLVEKTIPELMDLLTDEQRKFVLEDGMKGLIEEYQDQEFFESEPTSFKDFVNSMIRSGVWDI